METKVSHAKFYALLHQLPRMNKEDLVWQYSHLTTNSLSEFHERKPEQYARMIADMQKTVNRINMSRPEEAKLAELKRLRSAILHRLQKHGINTTDWNSVNSFMRQKRIAGKTLGEMTATEMLQFIPKMHSILEKDKLKQTEIERLMLLN